jgi:hypothetical protein
MVVFGRGGVRGTGAPRGFIWLALVVHCRWPLRPRGPQAWLWRERRRLAARCGSERALVLVWAFCAE